MIPDGYIEGLGRDYPHPNTSHLYKGTFSDLGLPMCKRGWNRDWSTSYSIWRGNRGTKGLCKVCLRRAQQGLEGVKAIPDKDAPDYVHEEYEKTKNMTEEELEKYYNEFWDETENLISEEE